MNRNLLLFLILLILHMVSFQSAHAQTETKDVKIKVGNEVKNNFTVLKINPCWHCDEHKCENCPEFVSEFELEEAEFNLKDMDKNKLQYTLPAQAVLFIELEGNQPVQKQITIGELNDLKLNLKDVINEIQ